MSKVIRYTIFSTRWGYFGLAGTESGLVRSHLPLANMDKLKAALLINLAYAQYDRWFFNTVQEQIRAYFEGTYVNFGRDIPLVMGKLSPFTASVLKQCRNIRFGHTISYGRLAEKTGRAGAARAVGAALAKNPLPLIIPCHRVTCANGKTGGFSAKGGTVLKRRMLKLERAVPIES